MSILRRFTDFILQNRLQAMGVAFVFSYIPILGSISVLIAGLVTLRKGAIDGLCVILAITLTYVLSYYSTNTAQSDIAYVGFGLSIIGNLLVWIFALLLKRYENWNTVLEYSALLGIVVVGLLHLFYPDIQGWWNTQLVKYFNKTAEIVSGIPSHMDQQQIAVIDVLKSYATGIFIVSILSNVILQLILSRWWQAAMFNPGGLRIELYQIRMSHVLGILLIAGFGLAWLGNKTIMDMLPVLCMAFAAAGLSLMHCYLATVRHTLVWLIIMYLLIIWLFPLSIMLLAIMALFDVWMNLRKRFRMVNF